MLDLTFGEQVKIILRRKGMTIKELAEKMEEHTGKKMSRQNLTQRLGRDNFQEQDMRQIAEILGCRFQLSIMEESVSAEKNLKEEQSNSGIDSINEFEADMTVGEVIDQFVMGENIAVEQVAEEEPVVYEEPVYEEEPVVYEEEPVVYEEEPVVYEEESVVYEEEPVVYEEEPVVYEEPVQEEVSVEDALKELESLEQEDRAYKLEKEQKTKKKGWKDRFGFYRKKEEEKEAYEEVENIPVEEPVVVEEEPVVYEEEPAVYEEDPVNEEEPVVYEEEPVYEEETVEEEPVGDVNPYTGREYETNSVRVHPKKIGYVQVYDREEHRWIDMTEWAFLGYQEQKKMLLGKDYDPPIYLD